jgi:hypothetical protein
MTTGQIPSSKTDWSAWSDCFYSNPVYDQMFVQQQTTIDLDARQQIVFDMQRMLYKDCPYVVLAYPYGLYAYRTGADDRFTNWPVIESDAVSPFSGTAGGPWFYFQVTPKTTVNLPPEGVSAGVDTTVALNETRSFTGTATDPDGDELNWTWKFTEPDMSTTTLYGQTVSYTFLNLGDVTVNLSVSDGWNPPVCSEISVTVELIENPGYLVGYVMVSPGNPVVAALVSVPGKSVTTNTNGFYNMTLSAGTYEVNVTAAGYGNATETGVVIVTGEETLLNFTLAVTSGSLRGHVYDAETGDALPQVVITVTIGAVTKSAVSNETGAYLVLLIPNGTCNVSATKADYETNETTALIVAGEETVLDIELTPVPGTSEGLSTAAWAAIIIVLVVIVAVAVVLLMRRGKGAEPSSAPPEPPKT